MVSSSMMLPTGSAVSQRARWAAGQPISDLMSRALAHPNLISLAAGFVDQDTLPVEITRSAVEEIMSEPAAARAALQYGTTPGFTPLRQLIRQQACEEGAHIPSLDQVVVTAGSNQLLHLVAESLFDPGDIVLCSAPTYFVFLGTLANLGVEALGVETDREGIVPEALTDCWQRLVAQGQQQRVKAIYAVPYFDNPQGISMPMDRRHEVVELAKRWSEELPGDQRVYVLADEAYRQLCYSGPDLPSTLVLDQERDTVVLAGTFSKSFSPGIRVGWGVLPAELVEPVCNQKGNIDFGSPNFNQHVMDVILRRGLFQQHVTRLRQEYGRKLQSMLDALERYMTPLEGVQWECPEGGLYVWLRLPEGLRSGSDGPLFDLAVERGVLYVPGEYCFAPQGAPTQKNTIRLSFGVQSCSNIQAGIQTLAEAIGEIIA